MTGPSVRRLTCPKCGGQFDYELIWGASFTAVRLGNARYTRCPLCHRFALFPLDVRPPEGPVAAVTGAAAASTLPSTRPVRRFSDLRPTIVASVVIGALFVLDLVVAFELGRPTPGTFALGAGVGALLVATIFFLLFLHVRELRGTGV